jgi:hypothetical protein
MLFIHSEVAGLWSSILSSPLIVVALIICSAYIFFAGKRILSHSFSSRLCIAAIILLSSEFVNGQNAIVTENTLTGNPISEWGVTNSSDFRNVNLNGYATDISVNKGQVVHFKIDAVDGTSYSIKIYRLGYYGGLGGRLKADLGLFTGVKQPDGIADATTGLLDCSNWSETTSWNVPADAVSGFYIVKLQDQNDATNINNIVFIVRDDGSTSQMLFQANDATWQAYNGYGGNNLYNGTTALNQGHASKVSYNRPFFIYNTGFTANGLGSDWYMNDEYPMIRFLEHNGYDMTYTTNTDEAQGAVLTNHKVLVAAGHDEYWSKEMRDNVENARAAGVNLAFFTGNEVYWKTRWENDASGKANRVLVCYKEGTLADGSTGEATCGSKCDVSSPVWTGLWRMGATYDAGKPENALTGNISWQPATAAIQVPYAYKDLRFWRNTSIPSLTTGQVATLAPSSLGYEMDFEQFPNSYPHGRITMSSTSVGTYVHKLSLYKDPSGAWVFGAGTVLWAWGLDDQHFGGPNTVNADMQQATINLFTDMHVMAGSIQSGLTLGTPSTDVTAPTSVITSPLNNSTQPISSQITITGTAADIGGAVGGVEVSVDGGTNWQVAIGTTSWTFSWNPAANGVYIIKSRAYDDSGNMEDGTVTSGPNVVQVTLAPAPCPCHIFTTQAPPDQIENDQTGIELGVKFKSSENGFITGVRFYKTTANVGAHIGELYDVNGNLLATATFNGETASGWQTVNFSNPVPVIANTTYVASYFSQSGNYYGTSNFFTTDINNSPLTGLADNYPTDPNGVYIHTSTTAFPTNSPGNKSNYWVDVTFNTTSTAIAIAGSDQTIAVPATTATLNGSGSTGTITDYTWTTVSGPNAPGISAPNAVSTAVTGLIPGTYIFQLSINGGISTSQVSVIVLPAGAPSTIFTTQFPTDNLSTGNPVELGVKFRSSQAGYINGIRFYKTLGNEGAHIGELYSSAGIKLASATFNGETTSGWQTVLFSAPVFISANTTYIAAYFSATGTYTATPNYFTTPVVNNPLTGLADGTDGANGVFKYTNTPAEPTTGSNQTNYWVDAIYSSTLNNIVANAGNDQTIILPVASASLDGSGSVNATSYTWTQVSGPNTAAITTPVNVTTTATGLIRGIYIFDLTVNGGASSAQVAVTVMQNGSTLTIFTTQKPPDDATDNDGVNNPATGIETGVKFRSSQSGFISGVRFYKTTDNLGIHVGELYATDGTLLARATFSSETASGWQTVEFSTPVVILANTTYIASYFSPLGNYKGTVNYFTTAVVNSPLTGLADGTDGPNGVYKYTAAEAMPVNGGAATNYWVDAIFSTSANPVLANAGPNQTIILPVTTVTLDGSATTGNITDYTWTVISGPNTPLLTTPGDVSTPATGLEEGTYVFQLSVNAGISKSQVTVTVLPAGSSLTIFTTQVPVDGTSTNPQPIELGVKFQSSQSGYINGVRFYKTAGNDGTHIGELYDASGNRLASATFVNETATGWQNVAFSAPVLITPQTTYVAAYYSPNGTYTGTANYFTTAVVNDPLTGLADGTDGSNGVYQNTTLLAGPVFPSISPIPDNQPNYWVDVVFTESSTPLPVQYLSFTATKAGNDAKLQWTTSQEENNKGFEVQKSVDGASWTVLGFVAGAGNSQTPRSYQYTDQDLAPGKYYYRLRQVDNDGKSDISKVVSVTISGELQMELLQNRPNPFNNSTSIIIIIPKAGRISLTVYDQLGRPIRTLLDADKLPGTYTIQMSRDGLSGGIYYYKLNSKDGSTTRKMTIY